MSQFASVSTIKDTTVHTLPPGVVDGDFLLLIGLGAWWQNPVLPSGWNTIIANEYNGTSGSNRLRYSIAWREASSEPASYTWGSYAPEIATMVRLTDIVGYDAFIRSDNQAATTTPTFPDLTTGVSNGLIIRGYVCSNDAVLTTVPTGYTSRVSEIGNYVQYDYGLTLLEGDDLQASAGATGTEQGTADKSVSLHEPFTLSFESSLGGGEDASQGHSLFDHPCGPLRKRVF